MLLVIAGKALDGREALLFEDEFVDQRLHLVQWYSDHSSLEKIAWRVLRS